MRRITKRSLAIGTAVVVAVGGGAAAWATWTTNGTAQATVQSGSAVPVSVTEVALIGSLIPGHPAGVSFKIANPNGFGVHVSGATLSGFSTSKSGCSNSNFQAVEDAPFTPFDMTANANPAPVNWANSIKLAASPNNACQDAPVTFTVTVNAESNDQ
jgi:hypothetical protein